MKTKLEKKIIDYAGKQLLCAVDADNNLYIGTSSMEKFLGYRADSAREKLASKQLKELVPEGFKLGKIQESGTTQSGIENFYPFDVMVKLMTLEVANGNKDILQLVIAGASDSIRSIALEQLGVQMTVKQRNEWLEARIDTKVSFPILTDSIQQKALAMGMDKKDIPWAMLVKKFQDAVGVKTNTRDELPRAELRRLDLAQHRVAVMLEMGASYDDAITKITINKE